MDREETVSMSEMVEKAPAGRRFENVVETISQELNASEINIAARKDLL